MASIQAYVPGDWRLVEPREIEKEAIKNSVGDLEDYFLQGPAFTIWDGDKAVMCGGIRVRPDEGGDAWLYCSKWIESHPMVARCVRDFMGAIVRDYNLKWVQVIVNNKFPKTLRWLSWLGFEYERLVPNYPQYEVYKRSQWA